jgi:hypothetical protein
MSRHDETIVGARLAQSAPPRGSASLGPRGEAPEEMLFRGDPINRTGRIVIQTSRHDATIVGARRAQLAPPMAPGERVIGFQGRSP